MVYILFVESNSIHGPFPSGEEGEAGKIQAVVAVGGQYRLIFSRKSTISTGLRGVEFYPGKIFTTTIIR